MRYNKIRGFVLRYCVLMTAYKDSKLINRIITQLPENWGVFVSLD